MKSSVLYFTLLITLSISSCMNKPASNTSPIGLQLISVRDYMEIDPIGTIEKIGDMGYHFIETFVYNNGKFYGMEPQEFKLLVNNNNMQFLGSMVFKQIPDSATWEATMQWWDTCIADHVKAGVEYLTTTGMNAEDFSHEDLLTYCLYLNEIGKRCSEAGIIFAYHNHTEEFFTVNNKLAYDFIIENTRPEWVFFQADLYWFRMADKDPVNYFTRYPGRFMSWHIKDETELGTSGKVDFMHIFKYSTQAGLKYPVVEIEKYNYDPLVSAKMAIDFMRNELNYDPKQFE